MRSSFVFPPALMLFLKKKKLVLKNQQTILEITLTFLKNLVLTNNILYFDFFSLEMLKVIKRIFLNAIVDVFVKVSIFMEIIGFNHQVNLDTTNRILIFELGFSSLVLIKLPNEIDFFIADQKNKIFELISANRFLVIKFSQKIRKIKMPNVYTGHGLRYLEEKIVKKQVKK